jgi:hypothetical protein
MSKDLHLEGLRYNTAAAVFFLRLLLLCRHKVDMTLLSDSLLSFGSTLVRCHHIFLRLRSCHGKEHPPQIVQAVQMESVVLPIGQGHFFILYV